MSAHNILLIFFGYILLSPAAWAQHGRGLLWNQEAYAMTPVISEVGQKNSPEGLINRVDLTPYCPPIQDQGEDPTCTAWAVGYGAMTIELAIQKEKAYDDKFLSDEAFSMSFIYNQIKLIESCDQGTFIDSALELIQNVGNLKARDFDEGDCYKLPSEIELQKASSHKISHFAALFPFDAKPKDKIRTVKKSLVRSHPVIIRMDLTKNFEYLRGYEFWYPDEGFSAGMHAMVVVGFDNGKGDEGAFKIMNSWGKGWGKDGFCWVNYRDFARHCWGAYQISLTPQVEDAPVSSGQVKISIPQVEGNKIVSQFLQPEKHKYAFKTQAHHWKTGERFQMHVSQVTGERFLYAFSYDGKRNIKVHWPRDESLNEAYSGKHESSLIPSKFTKLTLPASDIAFLLREKGREQVVLLFSAVPIPDINERLQMLKRAPYSFQKAFEEAFKDILLEEDQYKVLSTGQQLNFSSKPGITEKIIPIIFEFDISS